MRTLARRMLFGMSLAMAAAVTLVPHTAFAVPCCSAPICSRESPPPPPICASCSPSCFTDDDSSDVAVDDAAPPVDFAHDFDADAGVCHAVS